MVNSTYRSIQLPIKLLKDTKKIARLNGISFNKANRIALEEWVIKSSNLLEKKEAHSGKN